MYEDGYDTDNTTQDTILDEENEEMTSETEQKEQELAGGEQTERKDKEAETEKRDKELHPFIRALFKNPEN